MNSRELATSMGHKSDIISEYEAFRKKMVAYNNEHISELDIIFFLKNILWSANFELVAKILDDYGMVSRLDQWKEAFELETKKGKVIHMPYTT